jgi:cyclase
MRVRVIPVLLLHNGGLVKSVQFKNYRYVGDPINAVKIFNEKEVDEIIVLDITATTQSRNPNLKLIKEIASEAFMPLAYGGGVKDLSDIKSLISSGVEKVIINASAIERPDLIREASEYVGSQSVVVSIDVKKNIWGKNRVITHNARKMTKLNPVLFAKKMEEYGAGELFINAVDKDGTYRGYDLELIKSIAKAVTIPIIACGGASELEDFTRAIDNGASAVAAGSMFVFQRPHQAVLISYFSQKELKDKLFKS